MQQISREELYALVWSAPTQRVARQLGVSDVYVGHVCIALDVPKPPRGWWAKKRVGAAVATTPLAPPRPGHPTFWIRGQKASIRPFRVAAGPAKPSIDGFHHLIRISGRISAFGRPRPTCICLVPRHPRSIDLTVTSNTFVEALRFANVLFLEMEARGHRVDVIPGRQLERPPIEVWEHPPSHVQQRVKFQVPVARWPTVATLGGVAIGLAIVETHAEQEMQYVGDGQYVHLPDLQRGRTATVAGISWLEWQMRPQGRLRLVAYSASRSWRSEWRFEPKRAASQVGEIIDDIEKAADTLRERSAIDDMDASSLSGQTHSASDASGATHGQ